MQVRSTSRPRSNVKTALILAPLGCHAGLVRMREGHKSNGGSRARTVCAEVRVLRGKQASESDDVS